MKIEVELSCRLDCKIDTFFGALLSWKSVCRLFVVIRKNKSFPEAVKYIWHSTLLSLPVADNAGPWSVTARNAIALYGGLPNIKSWTMISVIIGNWFLSGN